TATRDNYTFENKSSIQALIPDLFATFFRIWDDPGSTDDFLSFFTPDAHLVFSPSVPAKGRSVIQQFSDNMIHPEAGPVGAL
ncbi:uncharacterized protein A1O5_06477, partial [Cladophialophora psammophila CBS 110553]